MLGWVQRQPTSLSLYAFGAAKLEILHLGLQQLHITRKILRQEGIRKEHEKWLERRLEEKG